MPFGFMRITTVSPNPGRIRPQKIKDDLVKALADQRVQDLSPGAKLWHDEVFFAVGSDTAIAVIQDLDHPLAVKMVSGAVGANGWDKFVGTAHAHQVFDHANDIASNLGSA
jgi:hypothetical protein